MPKMTDDQMLSQLETLERQAVGYYTGEVEGEQAKAMDYYMGKPFGTEEPGRSAVVSSDVWDVVEGLTPMVLRPFVASDDVVKFNALGPDDEEAAQQESEYINWVITQRNDSFSELVAWVKTGLLQKNGIVKYWWEETKQSSIERYDDVSDDVFALLAQDKGVEIVEHTEEVGLDGLPTHDVVLRTTEEQGFAKFCVIPPEEFLISRDATGPNPKLARFVQHRRMVTIGELRAMDYDVADDMDDGFDADPQYSHQYLARRSQEEQHQYGEEGSDPTLRQVLFKETYWQIDQDGDGTPELRKLCTVGRQILADEETEEVPFAAWTPYPQPFKFYGRCPADETLEIQLIKSTILRETMNNIYTINNNRTYANESVMLDDLIDNQIAGVVRVKGQGNVAHSVAAAEVTPIGNVTMPMIEYWDSAKENRTGFTRYNQGTDANSLNKTATGIRIIAENANLRVEIISRAFANAMADLMRGIHGLCRRHATKAETVRLRGKWVPIDPRQWKKRQDLSISVGLGNADQQMKLQGIQMLMNEQKALAQGGVGIVQPQNFYAAAAKLAEVVGFKNAEEFFSQPQQQGLPPEAQQALQQAQMQIQQLSQELQDAKSGMAAKQLDAQVKMALAQGQTQNEHARIVSAERIAQMNNETKHEVEELKGYIQLLMAKMEPPPALASDVEEDMADPEEAKPDPLAMLAEALQGLNKPRKKRMSITAPSGMVYQGEIADHDEQEAGA